ncbi:FeoA domain [Peptoniphilus sp. ING2-D1G]|nr:FeoA domain [Peptoniphilus sp. ING2-D1G]
MNLLMVPKNVEFEILKIKDKRFKDEKHLRHIENLGFVKGAKIKIINENGSNLIVKVKDSRVAIGSDIASAIMIKGERA